MNCLSDMIEGFIKRLLEESHGKLDLQRNEMAVYFKCAPSQINYVLTTRFSLDRGYFIESRRGGGGYIRITRIDIVENDHILRLINERIGDEISQRTAEAIIERMLDGDVIGERESMIMKSAMQDQNAGIPYNLRDSLRAALLKSMLGGILKLHGRYE